MRSMERFSVQNLASGGVSNAVERAAATQDDCARVFARAASQRCRTEEGGARPTQEHQGAEVSGFM